MKKVNIEILLGGINLVQWDDGDDKMNNEKKIDFYELPIFQVYAGGKAKETKEVSINGTPRT